MNKYVVEPGQYEGSETRNNDPKIVRKPGVGTRVYT